MQMRYTSSVREYTYLMRTSPTKRPPLASPCQSMYHPCGLEAFRNGLKLLPFTNLVKITGPHVGRTGGAPSSLRNPASEKTQMTAS